MKTILHCCGCGKLVVPRLTSGKEIYPHRQDLHQLPFWKCDACGNFVGCHHKTKKNVRVRSDQFRHQKSENGERKYTPPLIRCGRSEGLSAAKSTPSCRIFWGEITTQARLIRKKMRKM